MSQSQGIPPCRSNDVQPDLCKCPQEELCPCGPNSECLAVSQKRSRTRSVAINLSAEKSQTATQTTAPSEKSPAARNSLVVDELMKKSLLTPCETCAIQSYAKRRQSIAPKPKVTPCETCSSPKTSSVQQTASTKQQQPNPEQSKPDPQQQSKSDPQQQSKPDPCPSKISVATSCENWKSYLKDLVKDNLQSLVNEHNLGCSTSCSSKLQSDKTKTHKLNEDVTEKSSPVASQGVASKQATTSENVDLDEETRCESPECPMHNACKCHYPPAFNQVGCTGKITGACECGKKPEQ